MLLTYICLQSKSVCIGENSMHYVVIHSYISKEEFLDQFRSLISRLGVQMSQALGCSSLAFSKFNELELE